MPSVLRPYRRFPVHCPSPPTRGPSRAKRPGEILSLTVTLPNEQCIRVPEAVVRWSRGQECTVETIVIKSHTHTRLQHYVKRLVREPGEMIP